MLILSVEHPHFARCQAFANAQGIPIREIGAASEDSSFDLLQSSSDRVALAVEPQVLETLLAAWARAPKDARAPELLCIGQEFRDAALADAWREEITPEPCVFVDHNLSTGEVLAWSLVWGAAVPLFEQVVHAKEQGVMARARAAAKAVQDVRKAADAAADWRVKGQDERSSVGGFIQSALAALPDLETLPKFVREVGSDAHGLFSANAEKWSKWTPVFEASEHSVTLRGKGRLMLNGRTIRTSGTDVFYVRRVDGLPLRFVGEPSTTPR